MKNILQKIYFLFLPLLLSGCWEGGMSATEADASASSCWSCQLMNITFNAINTSAKSTHKAIVSSCYKLLGIMVALYLAVLVLKSLIVLTTDWKGLYINLIKLFGRTVIAAILLSSTGMIIEFVANFLEPIISLFLGFSVEVLKATRESIGSVRGGSGSGGYILSSELQSQMGNLMLLINKYTKVGFVLGFRLMTTGFLNFFVGIYVVISVFTLFIYFPFYFIEAFLRLGLSLMLLPFYIVAWVFPFAQGSLKGGLLLFFDALMQVFFSAIYISLFIMVIKTYLDSSMGNLVRSPEDSDSVNTSQIPIGVFSFILTILFLNKSSQKVYEISSRLAGGRADFSFVNGAINKLKATASAAVLAIVAVGAYACGAGTIAEKAAKEAKNKAKEAAEVK